MLQRAEVLQQETRASKAEVLLNERSCSHATHLQNKDMRARSLFSIKILISFAGRPDTFINT